MSDLNQRFELDTNKLKAYFLKHGIKNILVDEESVSATLNNILSIESISGIKAKTIKLRGDHLIYELYWTGNQELNAVQFKNEIVQFQKALDEPKA